MSEDKILSRKEIIDIFRDEYHIDISCKLIFKVVDYSNNPLAPERTAYKVYYYDKISKKRTRYAYYPNTVGIQVF